MPGKDNTQKSEAELAREEAHPGDETELSPTLAPLTRAPSLTGGKRGESLLAPDDPPSSLEVERDGNSPKR